jgi:hypothetical protein
MGGFFAFAARNGGEQLFARPTAGKATRAIVLWMDGGPSQIDTFDPKPGEQTGGEFRAIETAAQGVAISEHLPQLARRMDRLAVVRSLTSPEGDHLRARYYLHTGYPIVEGFARPAAGAVVSQHVPAGPLPNYVTLGSPGIGPAWLGPANAPFAVDDLLKTRQTLVKLQSRKEQIGFLRQLGAGFVAGHTDPTVERRDEIIRQLETLVETPFADALDVERASPDQRQRYGDHDFGTRCLAAFRLIESGVKFVEVQLGGWDTHIDNFTAVRRLCAELDGPWAALIDDLEASGLWDETVVLWLGEFGRTPVINAQNGRDHYPRVTSAVLGGGGLHGGRVVGASDAMGMEITRDPVRVPDLFATLFASFGIDPSRRFTTEFGGTAAATDEGHVIPGLL